VKPFESQVTGITDPSQSHVSAFSFENKIKDMNISKMSPSKMPQKHVQFSLDQPSGCKVTPSPAAPDFKQFITASTNAHSAFGFSSSDK